MAYIPKGTGMGGRGVARRSIIYASDVPLRWLRGYLCSLGPGHCPKCDVPCGFGMRYLREIGVTEDDVSKMPQENQSDGRGNGQRANQAYTDLPSLWEAVFDNGECRKAR